MSGPARFQRDRRRPDVLDDREWLERRHLRDGEPVTAIAGELGVDREMVMRALRRHGLEFTHARHLRAGFDDDPAVTEFLEWRDRRRDSARTVTQTKSVLRRALDGHDARTMSAVDLERWLYGLDISDPSRATYHSALMGFFRFMQTRGHRHDNPMALVTAPKVAKGLPRPLTRDEFAAAMDDAPPRMRCWLALGYYQGLRRSEICALDVGHVNADQTRVRGKGGKERVIPTHPAVWAELVAYGLPAAGRFWSVHHSTVGDHIARHLRGRGIDATCHPLRHSFATNVYRASGKDLLLTQRLLGHASPATTAIYTLVAIDDDATAAVHRIT